ncbi:type II secretion system protein M [Maricaulis maris]|uniref:General secretion pathway protein M n=1 Tax=Maricaulis maris TaxID=74318 RepID=A0A495D329_9PROT|nr:type II secretion system protein M [Maricaulis maris]RKQ96175.1 general secretion pathway protein M [Maricaulis maris]
MMSLLNPITAWWEGLTVREQVMLGIAGALAVVLAVTGLIVQPLMGVHDRARQDYAASMRLYRAVEADADRYRMLAAGQSASDVPTQSLRAVVGSLALRHDIALARMVPGEDGRLTVNIERAETAAVLRWLVDLEERYGVRPQASSLDRVADGFVSASIVLSRGGV